MEEHRSPGGEAGLGGPGAAKYVICYVIGLVVFLEGDN